MLSQYLLTRLLLSLLALLTFTPFTANGHMLLFHPPPLRGKNNPHAGANVDWDMTNPLKRDGSDYPCKGTLSLLTTPQATAVDTWTAGGTYNFTVAGGAYHGGGSCQASLSIDGGKTFRVLHSYEGGCPRSNGQSSFNFQVPGDIGTVKQAVFAWTWFNLWGNREMYMNCAVVDIVGDTLQPAEPVQFGQRPEVFKANIGSGCTTIEGFDLKFPNPGPDVTSAGNDARPPLGDCGVSCGDKIITATVFSTPHNVASSTVPFPNAPTGCLTTDSSPPPTSQPANRSWIGWAPGNDWPEWFTATGTTAAAPLAGSHSLSTCLIALLVVWILA